MYYDVVVIGGGPCGLMAAIAAGEQGAKVLLIEKKGKLGQKLLISGGGRCNVTNRMPVEKIIEHIPGNGRFLYSAFSTFSNEDIIYFFNQMGVKLKEEDNGRMFPVSNKAQTVMDALFKRLKEYGVEIKMNTSVIKLKEETGKAVGVILEGGKDIQANAVVIATGGKSVPETGSTGDGYQWAKQAGHTITDLFPTEVPITSKETFIKERTLQGISLKDVALSVMNPKGKVIKTHRMDMIFTHFGISGPAALRSSQFVVKTLKKYNLKETTMKLDVAPDETEEMLYQRVVHLLNTDPKKAIKNSWKSLLPERYLYFLLKKSQIDLQTTYANISHDKIRDFVHHMKHFSFKVNGTLPIEKAFVTGGGVSIKEINPKEMSSKKMEGLYFCGEVLDIYGYTGGFNITAALVTGRVAGLHAGKRGISI